LRIKDTIHAVDSCSLLLLRTLISQVS